MFKTISTPKIDLPKGGGAIKGIGETFQPNVFSGTGSYSIPVHVTPARGFEPQLSLEYDSGAGNSEFGIGFSLSLPKISIRTENGIPRYDGNDIFVIGATELVPRQDSLIKNQNGWDIIEYLPRVVGEFSQIQQYVKTDKSESYWIIINNENITSSFGTSNNARIYNPNNPSQIFEWLIETSLDAKGNEIAYTYETENNINVPNSVWEQNRSYNNKYIGSIQYGNYTNKEGAKTFAFEIIFNYGQYNFSNINQAGSNPYAKSSNWGYRPDSFSSYISGFEIRTCRLCYSIAIFHHFEKELGDPYLVKNLELKYKQTNLYNGTVISNLSILNEACLIGYKRNGNKATDAYEIQEMPPIRFGFSEFNPPESPEFKELNIDSGAISGYLNNRGLLPIDMEREGISGLLYHNENTILYCEPQGQGTYSSPKPPKTFPLNHNFSNGNSSFVDLDGNGELELMVRNLNETGFYQKNDDGCWNNYRPFETYPTDYSNPDLEEVSLSNNGKTDLLLAKEEHVLVYPSIGKKGFDSAIKELKQDDFPSVKKGYLQEYVGFTNLLGDGLSHRVRITKQSVECWPDLGYGRFDKKIVLGNAPDFGNNFDISRLFLTDIDGSGTSDLVYVYPDKIELFINKSGNSFSDAITVYLPEPYTEIDQISFFDVLGNGTTCLVFTKISPEPRHYYYDFIGETILDDQTKQRMKPYLLNEIDNNMGAITQMQYCSSVKFYLEDKKAGRPWITKLPFPVQVIEKVIHKDLINVSRYTSRYKYHDGYYDSKEKMFCGFGYVETWDSESYEDFQKNINNQNPNVQEIGQENFVPPVYTRIWHHVGASFENSSISNQYKQYYFNGDKYAYDFPDSIFDKPITNSDTETIRQAYFAMRGHIIRSEVYSDDNTELSKNPYTVEESNVEVKLYQPRGDNKYAIYMVNPRESILYHYERNPDDPRVEQHFSLETDDYGNELQSCSIFLQRRSDNISGATAFPEQQILKGVMNWTNYVSPLPEYLYCHTACEEQTFEINGLDLQINNYFSFDKIKEQLQVIGLPNRSKIIPYNEPFTKGVQARQLTWNRLYFWNNEQTDVLQLGSMSQRALVHHSEQAVFTKDFSTDVFGGKLIDATEYENNGYLTNIIYTKGGYFYDQASIYWWNKGIVQHYFSQSEPSSFFMPYKTENTFAINTQSTQYKQDTSLCKKTTIGYDDYYLSPVSVTEEIGEQMQNTVTAIIDCVTRKPMQLIDINNNSTQLLYDPLGQVIVTSIFGTTNGVKTGDMTLYPVDKIPAEYNLPNVVSFNDIWQNPQNYLQGASSYFYYDLTAWLDRKQPIRSIDLVSFNYYNSSDKNNTPFCKEIITYSDGFGRKLETKEYTGTQWQVSGRTVYNNKAKPFEQYLPYFSDTADYEDQKNISSPPPTVIHYDPLLRPIRVDYPKGFFTKVEFNAWENTYFDEDDTVLDSEYYKKFKNNYPPKNPTQQQIDEKDALDKAARFYNTPETKIINNIGNVFLNIQTMENKKTLTSYIETDVLGRVVKSIDARLYASNLKNQTDYYNFNYSYAMAEEQPTLIDSVDAGTEMHLNNIFGNQLWSWTPRNYCQVIIYDKLQRKINVFVEKIHNPGPVTSYDDFNLVEVFTYGEGQVDAENKNLNGELYQLNDLSGIIINAQYGIQGELLQTSRQMVADYKTPANWNNKPVLEEDIYTNEFTYNALKQVLTETTPDNSVTTNSYNQLGLLNTVSVEYKDKTTQKIIDNIEYNQRNQRKNITYGNGINTSYTHEDATSRLLKLYSRGNNTIVQDISYTYDPVGNITRTRDNTYETVFNNNQQVNPLSDYTYDALYRLIKANGRQHPGINTNTYKNNKNDNSFKQCIFSQLPSVNDTNALENYSEIYTYDDSGNLISKQHTASSSSYTRETPVEDNSNRLQGIEYDVSGNHKQLDINASVTLSYNCCENLVKTGIIERPGELDDCDYYLYDSSEMRTRKVSERMSNGGAVTNITDKIYFGNFEIKRNKTVNAQGVETTTLERQTLRIMDDEACIAIIHYWVKDDLKREVNAAGVRSTRFQIGNNLGSVSLEMDANALLISYEEYFPYGGTAIIAGTNQKEVSLKDYRYSGKERDDSTGMYYYGARYYIPWLGRWNKPDPAGTVDGLNLYAFVNGNPVSQVDEDGTTTKPPKKAPEKRPREDEITTQEGLSGKATQERKTYFPTKKNPMSESQKKRYVNDTAAVFALLKINGVEIQMGCNGRAGSELDFFGMGGVGDKKNPHAEDWSISSFRAAFLAFKEYFLPSGPKTLSDFLSALKIPDASHNTGTAKSVFSLRINYSPCEGCVDTIINFKKFLTTQLGDGSFILRVKFLRPYNLPYTIVNSESESAQAFIGNIKKLYDAGIKVRVQPYESARKMDASLTKAEAKEFHTEVIGTTLKGKENMANLTKTWRELGVNRKAAK